MSHLSRRRFLEESMLAATAAVTAGAAAPLLAQEQSKSANERLSVAVVGVNGRGKSHTGAFSARQDTEVTYICDADEAVGMREVARVAERQGRAPKYVQDMRTVFDDPTVDIVTTATPNHWHSLVAIWAIQAGKDVYVEKPVSHNVSEGRRIVQAARRHKKIVQTGTQCRSMPGTIAAIEHVHAGKIRKVSVARGLCYKRRKSIGERGKYEVPSSVDYNLWLGPAQFAELTRPKLHYDWHWQWPYGNGELGNQGIHQMDICRWGLGVNRLSSAVFSYGGRFGYVDAGDTANTQVVVHDYGKSQLVFEVRGLETEALRDANVGVIFEGSDGYVVLSSYTKGAAFDLDGNMVKEFIGGGDDAHFDNFVQAVRSRDHHDLNADILQGHLSSALCHTGNISYRMGRRVSVAEAKHALRSNPENSGTLERVCEHLADNEVDLNKTEIQFGDKLAFNPKTETFVDNTAADAHLSREYRAPFVVPSAEQV